MFIRHFNEMPDSDVIDGLVCFSLESIDEAQYESGDENVGRYGNSDTIAELKETIMSMKMTIESQDKRMSQLELELERLKMDAPKDRPKTVATMPLPYAMKHTASPLFGNDKLKDSAQQDGDTDSFSNVSRSKSETPTTNNNSGLYANRTPNPAVFSLSTPMVFKNNSAISSRGYNNKLILWGTVFTSLMIGCMKKYIQTTSEVTHVIDESFIMKTYTKIVGDLYHRSKYAELPAVQSHELTFLAKMFSRRGKEEVPESTAKTWVEMNQHPDGVSCMSVIESIFTSAKMVPEAMMHPMSQVTRDTSLNGPFLPTASLLHPIDSIKPPKPDQKARN